MKQLMTMALLLAALGLAAAPVPGAAQPIPGSDPVGLRGDFSGIWFNPAQSGHGLQIDVIDRGRATVAWYTFDPDGRPLWLYGLGELDALAIRAELFSVSGGRFPPQFDPAAIALVPWGTVDLQFSSCDNGTLSWTPTAAGYSAGSMPLARLTSLQGARCIVEEDFAEQRIISFERGPGSFEAVFADLPVEGQDIYELDFAHGQIPPPLAARRGVRLTGHNRSDDLAMLVVAPLGGLLPETPYRVELELELASDVPRNCAGIGGSPGDSVYIKLGVSSVQPKAEVRDEGGVPMLRLNVDFGNQAEGGASGRVVGTLANSGDCEDPDAHRWELKTLSTQGQRFNGRTDSEGRLWLLAGTDSAFEGLTSVYFTTLRVRLDPLLDPE